MGFTYHKSVNLGPVGVNLSSSGLGYSVGGRGFRFCTSARASIEPSSTRKALPTHLLKINHHHAAEEKSTTPASPNTRELQREKMEENLL
jgi:hypothetical protein